MYSNRPHEILDWLFEEAIEKAAREKAAIKVLISNPSFIELSQATKQFLLEFFPNDKMDEHSRLGWCAVKVAAQRLSVA